MKLYTAKVIAAYLDMTERNVRMLKDKGILKEHKPGLYRLKPCVVDYVNFLRGNSTDADNLDYQTERAKLTRAKRELAEMDKRARNGELHEAEAIEAIMSDMLIRFRQKMMAIPAKQSPILALKQDEKEIFRILKDSVDEALEELADYDALFSDDDEKEGADNGNDKAGIRDQQTDA